MFGRALHSHRDLYLPPVLQPRVGRHPAPRKVLRPAGLRHRCKWSLYRCLQNKRPLQNHTPRVSTPLPPKFNVDEVNIWSGSACEINTRFCKTGSRAFFSTLNFGGAGAKITLRSYLSGRAFILQTPVSWGITCLTLLV